METKIWQQDSDHAVVTAGALVVCVWRGANTYRNWRAQCTPVFEHIQKTSNRVLMLTVIEPGAKPPDQEARRELDELSKTYASLLVGTSVLVVGSSGRIMAVRAVVTAVNIFSKLRSRVFDLPEKAIESIAEMAKESGASFDRSASLEALKIARKAFPAP